MGLFSKYTDASVVLRGSPGPSPWYLRLDPPRFSGFFWDDAGGGNHVTSGKTLLRTDSGEVVAILNMYNYCIALDDRRILVWNQRYETQASKAIDFVLLDIDRLPTISDIDDTLQLMFDKKIYLFHRDGSSTSFQLPTNLGGARNAFQFPADLNVLDELLVLANTTEADSSVEPSLAIFRLLPRRNEFEIFPQDWFNKGGLDYGYQWVTRVARDASSGLIYGEGFRISHFVLDETNRQVEKWFHDDPFFEAQRRHAP